MGNPRNNKNKGDRTRPEDALHNAARSGYLKTVQSICTNNPAAVNSRDKHSRTPLHLAAWAGQTEVVNYLCKNKADVGAAALDDMGAIHFAAQKGHLEIVRALLSAGVSIKATTRKGLTPLHFAAQGSSLDLVKYLVRKGASLTSKTKSEKTPLDLAKKEDIISYLEECCVPSKLKEEKAAGATDEINENKKKKEDDGKDEKLKDAIEDPDNRAEDLKRKANKDGSDSNISNPKKAKVSLDHLLAADDDAQEED